MGLSHRLVLLLVRVHVSCRDGINVSEVQIQVRVQSAKYENQTQFANVEPRL